MQRSFVRHWSERAWKKPRNTPRSFACFFQVFAAQLIAEIHSIYLTDSGEKRKKPKKTQKKACLNFGKVKKQISMKLKPIFTATIALSVGASVFCSDASAQQQRQRPQRPGAPQGQGSQRENNLPPAMMQMLREAAAKGPAALNEAAAGLASQTPGQAPGIANAAAQLLAASGNREPSAYAALTSSVSNSVKTNVAAVAAVAQAVAQSAPPQAAGGIAAAATRVAPSAAPSIAGAVASVQPQQAIIIAQQVSAAAPTQTQAIVSQVVASAPQTNIREVVSAANTGAQSTGGADAQTATVGATIKQVAQIATTNTNPVQKQEEEAKKDATSTSGSTGNATGNQDDAQNQNSVGNQVPTPTPTPAAS